MLSAPSAVTLLPGERLLFPNIAQIVTSQQTSLRFSAKSGMVCARNIEQGDGERIMSRFAFTVCALICLGLPACPAWGSESTPFDGRDEQDRVSAEEGSAQEEYWSVCCRYMTRSRGRWGGTVNCLRCTVGRIDASYRAQLPSHCKWFKQREQAENYFHKRHTCP